MKVYKKIKYVLEMTSKSQIFEAFELKSPQGFSKANPAYA